MDFRRLSYFLAVVEHTGFTSAAKALFVSQPALSLAVRQLEEEVGTELLYRLGRGVRLTPAGEAFIGPARQALRDLEIARASAASIAGLEAGTLSLGSLPTLAADPLADLVGRFRAAHPGVVVDLAAPEDTADLVALLRDGRCEVAIAEPVSLPDTLSTYALGDQRLLVILPPGTRRSRRSLPVEELEKVPFVAAPEGTSSRRLLDEAFAAVGLVPTVAVVAAQREAILPLVAAGAGAAMVPETLAERASRLGAVIATPRPQITRKVVLAHRPGPLAPAARRFLELALDGDTGSGSRRAANPLG
jgi:LysR family transcriptional regulator, carnitine catabolism transcriptional activator